MNAVFFDMDGTLIDSRADLASAVNFTRKGLGLAPLPQEQVVSFVGCGARHLLENAIPEVTGRFDELWPQYLENYRAHMLDETVLYPGVRRTIAELADRGWLMGINTNKPNFAARTLAGAESPKWSRATHAAPAPAHARPPAASCKTSCRYDPAYCLHVPGHKNAAFLWPTTPQYPSRP